MALRRASPGGWFGDHGSPDAPPAPSGYDQHLPAAAQTAVDDRPAAYGLDAAHGGTAHGRNQPLVRADAPGRELAEPYREESPSSVAIRFERDLAVTGTAGAGTVPRRRGVPTRQLLAVGLFWVALLATVSLWWFNTPADAIRGQTSVALAAGRITGLMAGFVLLVEVLSMARLRWVEAWFGSFGLLNWHRALGTALVVLVFGHAVLLFFAYSWATRTEVVMEAWTMITTLRGLVGATAAALVLLLVALLSTRWVRRHLPYELWHAVHMGLYLVVFLAYGHQFALGTAVLRPGVSRWYWIGLHLFVGACLLWGRVLRPIWYNLRHNFQVLDVVEEIPGWVSIYLGGRRMDWAHAAAGQYVRCRFLAPGCWWQSHPFSISAAPNGEWLRISVKGVGEYSRRLHRLQPGTGVLLSEAEGSCTAARRVREKAVIITGSTGIAGSPGVAPVVPLLGDLPPGTIVLYRAHSKQDLVFRDELEQLAEEREGKIFFVLGGSDDHWPKRAFSPVGLRELVPDILDRDVYLCAPRWLVRESLTALRRLGVPSRQIHCDSYEF